MKNNLLSASILAFGLVVSSLIMVNGVSAQTPLDTIQFPVAELGNCKDKSACKVYCDDPSHIDACVTFAEKNGLMSPEQLAEAKQVQAAIAKGVKPPACNGKKECDAYCEEPSHMKECIAFGEASGFLKGRELEDAKKVIVAIDNGATPPACKGKEACDAYCSEPDHIEACMTFAKAAGFMTPEEEQNSEKMMMAIRKGVKPPNCRGREACDAFCAEPAHTDECINFSIAAGFMTEKEAEMAKKTGGKGPGGCIGRDACDAFCNNPENQQACIDFGRENGMISEEEVGRMQEGQKKFRESMQNLLPETADCMKKILGEDTFEKMKNGQAMPPRDSGEKMSSCFSQMGPPSGEQREQQGPPGSGWGMPPASAMPQEARDCVKSAIGEEAFAKFQAGSLGPNEQSGFFEKAKSCFEGIAGPDQQGQRQMRPQGQQVVPGAQFMPRLEGQAPPEGQPPPGEPFAPGTYPNQPPPEGQFPPPGEQFAPGTYPSPEGTSGAYPNQQIQYAPGTEPVAPISGGTEPAPLPPPPTESGTDGEIVPMEPILQAQPIEQTAPQSSNFDLKSSLAAVITAFREFAF
ncbi:MAG: hypothetical protein Q7R93_04675 [bacterium]|nr:hypothetical protein [bacterium]